MSNTTDTIEFPRSLAKELITIAKGKLEDRSLQGTDAAEDLANTIDTAEAVLNDTSKGTKELAFADELIPRILRDQKTATVRRGGAKFSHGDRVAATTVDGGAFATLEIERVATVNAIEVYDLIGLFDAEYGADTPEDVVHTLEQYYDEPIHPSTTVTLYVFSRSLIHDPDTSTATEPLVCPTCETVTTPEPAGTSPHIDTGEPVKQLACSECGAISDESEYRSPPAQ